MSDAEPWRAADLEALIWFLDPDNGAWGSEENLTDLAAGICRTLLARGWMPPDATAHLSAEWEGLLEMLAIFLGEDERFQVAVGGNPIAVDRMLDKARDILRRARKLVGGQ